MRKKKEKNPKKLDLKLSHCSHSLTCLFFQSSIRFFLPLPNVARLFLSTKKFPLLKQMHYAAQQISKHGSRSQSQFCIIVPALLLLLLLMLLCASIAKSCACFPLVHCQLQQCKLFANLSCLHLIYYNLPNILNATSTEVFQCIQILLLI